MMTRTLLVRCAPLAIAASAALPSIASAQDATTAEPVIVLPSTPAATAAPVAAPVAAPAPTIVLPEPVADPAPVAATQAEPASRATSARNTARTVSRPAAVAPRATQAAPAIAAPVAVAPALPTTAQPVEPAAAPVVAEPAAAEPLRATASDGATGEMALAGLLGVLGVAAVGGVAFAASRRRRRRALGDEQYDEMAYEPVVEDEYVEPVAAPAPVAARTAAPIPAPVFTAPAPVASAFAAPVVGAAAAPRTMAHSSGDPIALPDEVPETFEERDALLRELVAAEPDKANPFTSPRARARRAKLIIQSLARDFTSRKPRIDLSEYTNRWPALRGWQPATA